MKDWTLRTRCSACMTHDFGHCPRRTIVFSLFFFNKELDGFFNVRDFPSLLTLRFTLQNLQPRKYYMMAAHCSSPFIPICCTCFICRSAKQKAPSSGQSITAHWPQWTTNQLGKSVFIKRQFVIFASLNQSVTQSLIRLT